MGKIRIYGERSEAPSVLEEENRRLAKEVAKEGFVLLENDGVLPLNTRRYPYLEREHVLRSRVVPAVVMCMKDTV